MNILIVGCGKVGSQLAQSLSRRGHAVAIVDRNHQSFDQLGDDFSGYTVEGIPIDTEVLRQAGIEGCDILVAVTNDDNVNLMVAQVAKEIFGVPKVLTRIYDPRRRDVFSQFGLHTICPTSITTDTILSIIEEDIQEGVQMTIGDNTLGITSWRIPPEYVGKTVGEIPPQREGYAALGMLDSLGRVSHLGIGIGNVVIKEGDQLLCGRVLG